MATDLKDKTTEQLQGELKSTKMIMGALIGVLSVLFAVVIYSLFTREDNSTDYPLLVVAISCSAYIPFQIGMIKKINAELKSREGSN